MNKNMIRILSIIAVVLVVGISLLESDALARAGGGRSFGGRGSRSFSAPSRSYSRTEPSRQQASPAPAPAQPQPSPFQQPAGGFMRSFGGGLLGGLVGGMLFRSLGFGGMGGGFGGSGFGIFELILILVIGYFIYKMVSGRKREESASYQTAYRQTGSPADNPPAYGSVGQTYSGGTVDVDGLTQIRQLDPSFDEGRFKDNVMDIFFKIQGAWTNRDLSSAKNLLTEEMTSIFQADIDKMLREKQINRLENIAVRNVDITEAWQEAGQDFITALVYANLLDYTTDAATGQVVAGSKTEPVKFEEFWTFTRSVGNNPWRLSAINQA